MGIRALGSAGKATEPDTSEYEIYLKFLDGYDHWSEADPRLAKYYDALTRGTSAFAYDILVMSVVAHEILGWLDKLHRRENHGEEVVTVGMLTEAFILSARTACDAIAFSLGDVAPLKKGQAPKDSLRGLIEWAKTNTGRIDARAVPLLTADFGWFYRIRSLRDRIIHDGCHCNIHTDGHQFNLWVHSDRSGWILREPLFPFLTAMYTSIRNFSNEAADVIYQIIELPEDRRHSRVLSGIRIPALTKLVEITPSYSRPSP
jgi:hypothetical protein